MNRKNKILIFLFIVFIIIFCILILSKKSKKSISANSTINKLSNKKICWGIKRNESHKQPDLGKDNKELIDKYDGITIRK